MEIVIISPKTLFIEKQKSIIEKITISGGRIVFNSKAAITLSLKENSQFTLMLKNNTLFYKEAISGGFSIAKFGTGDFPKYAANAKGLVEMLTDFKNKNKKINIEPLKNNKGGISFKFSIGPLHEGGLWELIALPV